MSGTEYLRVLSDVDTNTEIYKIFEDDIIFFKLFFSLENYSDNINDKEGILKFINGSFYKKFLQQFESYLQSKENNYFTWYFQLISFLYKIRPKLLPIIIFTIPTALKFYSSYESDIKTFISIESNKSNFYFLLNQILERINNYSKIKANKSEIIKHAENYLFNLLFKENKKCQNPLNKSQKEERNFEELFRILYEDKYDEFILYLTKHPEIDIHEEIQIDNYPFLVEKFKAPFVSLIDICCLFGSIKCFQYLHNNNCEFGEHTGTYSIIGGNYEIVQILNEDNIDFHDCLKTTIKYHQYFRGLLC